jgi:hypothetical protein
MDLRTSVPLIKVVTRASTEEELNFFEHPRMPLLETPLFDAIPEGVLLEFLTAQNNERTAFQTELF